MSTAAFTSPARQTLDTVGLTREQATSAREYMDRGARLLGRTRDADGDGLVEVLTMSFGGATFRITPDGVTQT